MENEQTELLYTLRTVFQYIERKLCGLNKQEINFTLNEEVGRENAQFVKQVFILLQCLYPMHYIELHHFFGGVPMTADLLINFHMAHSIRMIQECNNIFQGLLYSCCFAYSMIEFTLLKLGNTRLRSCMHSLVFEVFSSGWVYQTYVDNGGIGGLRRYCIPYTLPKTLDFVGKCYAHQYLLVTQFEYGGYMSYFALDSLDNIFVLKSLVGHIKSLVKELYGKELTTDLYFRQSVRRTIGRLNQLQPRYTRLTLVEILRQPLVYVNGNS